MEQEADSKRFGLPLDFLPDRESSREARSPSEDSASGRNVSAPNQPRVIDKFIHFAELLFSPAQDIASSAAAPPGHSGTLENPESGRTQGPPLHGRPEVIGNRLDRVRAELEQLARQPWAGSEQCREIVRQLEALGVGTRDQGMGTRGQESGVGGPGAESRETEDEIRRRDFGERIFRGRLLQIIAPPTETDRILVWRRFQHLETEFERVLRLARKEGRILLDSRFLGSVEIVVEDLRDRSFLYLERVFQLPRAHYRSGFKLHHCANVAILSGVMAEGLGHSRLQLLEVVLAALLHEVGMLAPSWNFLLAPRKLLAREEKIVRTHTLEAEPWLRGIASDFPAVADVAAQHHEREDGSGYPYGLRGRQIHPYARIVGFADTLEAYSHDRPARPARGMRAFFQEYRPGLSKTFHADLWRAAFETVTPYPPGTHVELSSGATGVVVAFRKGEPMAPIVRLNHAAGGDTPGAVIDLCRSTHNITRVLG